MYFKLIVLFIMVLTLQSCSVKYISPKISELIYLEHKLIEAYKPIQIKDGKVNNVLKSVLYEMKLPSDFALLKVIETGIPTAYTGVSREIYITKSFIEALDRGIISENELRLVLIHELLHKKLRHSNKSLSSPSLTVSKVSAKKLVKIAAQIAGIIYLRNHGGATRSEYLSTYSTIGELIDKVSNKKTQQKYQKLLAMPFLGYSHSVEEEFMVDKMVENIIRKNNENVESYKDTLVTLKRVLETTSKFKVDSSELSKLSVRIEKLNKESL